MRKIFNHLFLALAVSLVCVPGRAQEVEKHEAKATPTPFIRASSNPSLTGTIISKAVDEKNDALFLRVKQSDGSIKDYLLDQKCDETCQKAINACKGGEQCSIRGKVDETAPSITPEFVRFGTGTAPIVETKTSKKADGTVVTWTRDTSNAKLGEAWRDASGMIWGDIVKKDDGSPRFMNHKDATDYCKSIGAELPSREDFIRLREYMGAKSGSDEGYTAQVLPNLTYTEKGQVNSRYFWSSSVHPDHSYYAYDFGGRFGYIGYYNRSFDNYYSVRCVGARR